MFDILSNVIGCKSFALWSTASERERARENMHQLQYTVCVAYDADTHMHSAASSSN